MGANLSEYLKKASDWKKLKHYERGNKYSKEIHVRIDENTYLLLKDICEQNGISTSSLVRMLIYSFLNVVIRGG